MEDTEKYRCMNITNVNTKAFFLKQYSLGQRHFKHLQLQQVNLAKQVLRQVELKQVNFNFANLNRADLEGANLSESSLVQANLSDTNLAGADFYRANLSGANLSGANLSGTTFSQANLSGANLNAVKLLENKSLPPVHRANPLTIYKPIKSDFRQANLTGAFLKGFDLNPLDLSGAVYDDNTKFPPKFQPLKAGMIHIKMAQRLAVQKLLMQFNHVYRCSARYLPDTLCQAYFDGSRPEYYWLKQFVVRQGNVSYVGTVSDFVNAVQLRWFQKWLNAYGQLCSTKIENFFELIKKDHLEELEEPAKQLSINEDYKYFKTRLSDAELDSSVIYMTRKAYSRLRNSYLKGHEFLYYSILTPIAEHQFSHRTIDCLDRLLTRACSLENRSEREILNYLKSLVEEWLATIDLNNAVIE